MKKKPPRVPVYRTAKERADLVILLGCELHKNKAGLARAMGVTSANLTKTLSTGNPLLSTLKKMADAAGITVDELLYRYR